VNILDAASDGRRIQNGSLHPVGPVGPVGPTHRQRNKSFADVLSGDRLSKPGTSCIC